MREFKRYVCEICNTGYEKEAYARQCESRGVEELQFRVGDKCKVEYDVLVDTFFSQKLVREKADAVVVEIKGPLSFFFEHRWKRLSQESRCVCYEPPTGRHLYVLYCDPPSIRRGVIDGTVLVYGVQHKLIAIAQAKARKI